MFRAARLSLIFLMAALLVAGLYTSMRVMASPAQSRSSSPSPSADQFAPRATVKPVAATAADFPGQDYDFHAEQRLLELANESRQKAGAPPLTLDSGLSQAARIHARAMLKAGQLSHQFAGEPGLPQRLAATTNLHLDQEAENVAYDSDPDDGHRHLMLSPPHRANLLNPAYNVVGLGVVRGGDRIYIVEDFGHALPTYSQDEVKERIAAAVNQARRQTSLPDLKRLDLISADEAACSMARADRIGTGRLGDLAQHHSVVTFTSLRPEVLPDGATRAITRAGVQSFSIGACYSRTDTYPTGVYWVVLAVD